jgi:excisionase family DNA binding protein
MSTKRPNEIRAQRHADGRTETTPTGADQVVIDGRVEKLLTYDDVANVLGVTVRTVYTLVNRGDLTALKVGGSSRVDPTDLRSFIERAKVTHSPAGQCED